MLTRSLNVSCCLLLALFASAAGAETLPAASAAPALGEDASGITRRVEIRVVGEDWGSTPAADIEAVLHSVADVLLEHFPGRRLHPILVARSERHPMTLYAKGPNGEYQVYLSATDRNWAQYVYQFAHELSHILANYEHHGHAAVNQWFEEALCEAASLYTLKRMAQVWQASPPHPHWAAFAPQFAQYVERFLEEPHRRLPPQITLATWFQTYERVLRADPYLRSLNEVVANLLLPVFEQVPGFWEAISYLHLEGQASNFREYMQTWHANAPADHKGIISEVMGRFGLLDDVAPGASLSQAEHRDPADHGKAGPPAPGPGTADVATH